MAATPAQREALIRAEQSARIAVRSRLVEFATSLWGSMGSWRDADVDRFVSAILPRVLAGQRTVAGLTDAYLAALTGASAVGVVDLTGLRGDVDAAEVYRRPATTLYTKLAEGQALPAALSAATARLADIVRTDLQLAMTHQARASMRGGGAGGFRRTLTGAENCALCAIASTQRYRRGDLLPMHPGCDCGVEPLTGDEPVGQVIDPDLLEQVHEEVAGFAGRSERRARDLGLGKSTPSGESLSDYTDLIVTRQHGEIGPVLSWRHQSFTGPAGIAS